MQQYEPNPMIVGRAVGIWKRLLRKPTFDNGDNSLGGMFAQALATKKAERIVVTDEQLNTFGDYLRDTLMYRNEHKYFHSHIGVDYGPDQILKNCAEAAGVNASLFPIKTMMFLPEEYVSISVGYGAEAIYHYPIPNTARWLVTSLHGGDIKKVMEYVQGGKPIFTVEDCY